MVLCWLLAFVVTGWVWPASEGISTERWQNYAGAIASASATMAGLTVAVAALLYALLSSPAIRFLHDKGALNRVLFDLMWCATAWILGLGLGLVAALPEQTHAADLLHSATVAALAGLFGFIPVGAAFWMLVRSSGKPLTQAHQHDFDKPTDPF